jgi:hypothetical protein
VADGWIEHAFKVERISEEAVTDLLRAIRNSPTMTRAQLRSILQALNDQWGALAAQDAADTMVLERQERGQDSLPTPIPQTVVTEEMADALAGYALAGEDWQATLERAAVGLDRTVRNASRQTVFEGAKSAGSRYARVPKVGACAFCLMLASRGAVYYEDTVTRTKNGERYHDHCHCEGREILDDSQVPEFNRRLQEQWYRTRAEVGEVWSDGSRHLTLPQWLDSIGDEREADRKARDLMQRLMELDEGVAVDAAKLWRHTELADQDGRRGGHLFESVTPLVDAIKAKPGSDVLVRAKSFFPDLPAQAIREWLGDGDGGAIASVLSDPELRIWKGSRRGFELAGVVDGPAGGRIRLIVVVNRVPRSSESKWQVVTAYPQSGDGIVQVTPAGVVEALPFTQDPE